MKRHQLQEGWFSNIKISKLLLGITTVGTAGVVSIGIMLHTSANAQNAAASGTGQASQAQQHLTVKEWGVQVPLPVTISDAYYVASTSTYDPATGQPNTVWISLTSLASKGCDASRFNSTGQDSPVGALIRVAPTDTDPVTGQLYTEKYPNGVLVGKYYYVYIPWKSKTCDTQVNLGGIDSAFGGAIKGMIQAASATN